jgi:hypothetical protein
MDFRGTAAARQNLARQGQVDGPARLGHREVERAVDRGLDL